MQESPSRSGVPDGLFQRLWNPRAVAVVGASATPNSLGHRILRYLRDHGYGGRICPVNPRYADIEGLASFSSVSAIPGEVDLALVLVGSDRVMAALEDCAQKGVPYVVVHASGFGEAGEDGRALEHGMITYARAHGMRVIGPNCIGLVNPGDRLVAGFSPLFSRVTFDPGTIGMVTQSGALGYGIVSLAVERGIRFHRIVNTGNEADLCAAELIADFLNDARISAILVYSEGVKRPQDWRALGALSRARSKPVIVLKSGRSEAGRRAAASHTASLAGDDALWDAAFRSMGMIRADDVDEMLDLAAIFEQPRRPRGPGVGVMTTSGGAGILAVDGLAQVGLAIPDLAAATCDRIRPVFPAFGTIANPLDLTGAMLTDASLFRTSLRAMADDPGVDALLVCFCVLQGAEVDRAIDDLLMVLSETDKPVLVSRTGGDFLAPGAAARLQQAGVPVFPTPARAARAFGALLRFSDARPVSGPTPVASSSSPAGWPKAGEALGERETKRLLGAAGLPVTRDIPCLTPEDAVRAAEAIGYPVVLKIDSPDVPHKTEAGGLRVGLRDADSVRAAFHDVTARVRAYNPDARLTGCIVQEQVDAAVAEILVGVTPSPVGPVLTVGLGGIFVEVFNDVTRRLAPVTEDDARALLHDLRSYPLLVGARGRPPADVDALVQLIVRIGELAAQWPGTWELDLNPVLVKSKGEGCRVVDALLVVH